MRIGWSIPLPGPFYLAGTLWRSKRRRRVYHAALPGWTCPHNHTRPDTAEKCRREEESRRARQWTSR